MGSRIAKRCSVELVDMTWRYRNLVRDLTGVRGLEEESEEEKWKKE